MWSSSVNKSSEELARGWTRAAVHDQHKQPTTQRHTAHISFAASAASELSQETRRQWRQIKDLTNEVEQWKQLDLKHAEALALCRQQCEQLHAQLNEPMEPLLQAKKTELDNQYLARYDEQATTITELQGKLAASEQATKTHIEQHRKDIEAKAFDDRRQLKREFDSAIKALQAKLKSEQDTVEQLQQSAEELKADLIKGSKEYIAERKLHIENVSKLQAMIDDARQQASEAASALAVFKEQNHQHESEKLARARVENDRLNTENKAQDTELKGTRQLLEKGKAELKELRAEHANCQEDIEKLKDTIDMLYERLDKSKDDSKKLHTLNKQLQNNAAALEADKEALDSELQRTTSALTAKNDSTVKALLAGHATALAAAQTDLKQATNGNVKLQTQLSTLTGELAKLRADKDSSHVNALALKSTTAERDNLRQQLHNTKQDADVVKYRLNETISQLRNELQVATGQIARRIPAASNVGAPAAASLTAKPQSSLTLAAPASNLSSSAVKQQTLTTGFNAASGSVLATVQQPSAAAKPHITIPVLSSSVDVEALLALWASYPAPERAKKVYETFKLGYHNHESMGLLANKLGDKGKSQCQTAREYWAEKYTKEYGLPISNRPYNEGDTKHRMIWMNECRSPLRCIARRRCECCNATIVVE